MFAIFFILMLSGMIFSEIMSPIADFLIKYFWVFAPICFVVLLMLSIKYGKKNHSRIYGIGYFFSISQILLIVMISLYAIMTMVKTEEDTFLSLFVSLIIGGIAAGYTYFNYRMIKTAMAESQKHKFYLLIVGILGWTINLFLMLS